MHPIKFYNTRKEYVELFSELFFRVFGFKGKTRCGERNHKQPPWEFYKHSVDSYYPSEQ